MNKIVVGVIDAEEVLLVLQSDAIEVHNRKVFAINNVIVDNIGDQYEAILGYDYILGSIEDQINSLFL